jgi:rod shape-determining protein MreC
VFVGQAVLDSGGVFGQVARVGELTSEVILVSDPAHAIPVQINRNGLRTIAVGTGDTSRLKLPYLPTSADVVAGDLLVTSGLGGGFPPGYPVGTVAVVKRDPAQSLADVDLRPAAALDRSRELMFVWLRPAQPGAAATLVPGAAPTPATAPAPTAETHAPTAPAHAPAAPAHAPAAATHAPSAAPARASTAASSAAPPAGTPAASAADDKAAKTPPAKPGGDNEP